MFVPSHLDQHLVEHIMLMDGVVLLLEICVCCWGKFVCACALVCLLVFAFVTGNKYVFSYAFVCVRVLVFCAWRSAGKMRGCVLPGTAKHGFGKRGPSTFWCVPLFIHVLPVRWLALASQFVWWFRWPEIWLTQNTICPAAEKLKTRLLMRVSVFARNTRYFLVLTNYHPVMGNFYYKAQTKLLSFTSQMQQIKSYNEGGDIHLYS